jgi:hypothetical protein
MKTLTKGTDVTIEGVHGTIIGTFEFDNDVYEIKLDGDTLITCLHKNDKRLVVA